MVTAQPAPPRAETAAVWRTLWRWHFYAGLICVPFILILSLTGALYLFKGDYEHFEERHWRGLPAASINADAQLAAALATHTHARLKAYRLPQAPGDAALIDISTPAGDRQIVVAPDNRVLADLAPHDRLMNWLRDLHGKLLIGRTGDWIVELVGSWAFVMVFTGLFLWFPQRMQGMAGVLYPRLRAGRRLFWRDIHAVTGVWVSGLAMLLLLSALPWTGVWGTAFRTARANIGVDVRKQDWPTGSATVHEGHAGMADMPDMLGMAALAGVTLGDIVARARPLALVPPVMITPPAAAMVGGRAPSVDWTVRADPQDRTRVVTYVFDGNSGNLKSRRGWDDKPAVDKIVNYGISWHEGALFGRINQAFGVLTALGMATLAGSALVIWWRRRPDGVLGAPPTGIDPLRLRGAMALLCGMALLLPLLGLSLIVIAGLEWLVLRRIPALARWLGLPQASASGVTSAL